SNFDAGASIVNAETNRYIFFVSGPTPLADFHRANGAVFTGSFALPAHFGDPASEYAAARDAAGLIDLSDRALLQFTGPDRLAFLQGMLSNDLRALHPFEGQYAAILTQQGKVVADVRALCAMNSFYLDFWGSLKEKVLAHLNRYLVADEVEIADRSSEYAFISVRGPRAETLVQAAAAGAALPAQTKQHAMIAIEGAAVCVVRENPGAPAYDLILPLASAPAHRGWKAARRRVGRRGGAGNPANRSGHPALRGRFQRRSFAARGRPRRRGELYQRLLPRPGDRRARPLARPREPKTLRASSRRRARRPPRRSPSGRR